MFKAMSTGRAQARFCSKWEEEKSPVILDNIQSIGYLYCIIYEILCVRLS